ncbi:MAG: efflux RND transporter periplasmic adaptor subunit [Cyclobacteriaceae bacterium]
MIRLFQKPLIFITSLLIISCSSNDTETVTEAVIPPVKLFKVGSGDLAGGQNYPARTLPEREVDLSFRISGPLTALNVEQGQYVKKGELIAVVDARDYEVTMAAKKARYEQSKAELERYKRLLEKQSIAENEYDAKLAIFRTNEADYINAVNDLNDRRLVAPFSGYIRNVEVENYEDIQAKQAIATLVDLTSLEVEFFVPETRLFKPEEVDHFEVVFENFPDSLFTAELKEVGIVAEPEGFPVTLSLDPAEVKLQNENTNIGNAAGFTVRVNIIYKESVKSQNISIPVSAIIESETENSPSVWVVNRSTMTVSATPVRLGSFTTNNMVEVTSGLENDAWIVMAGVHQLNEGERVKELTLEL